MSHRTTWWEKLVIFPGPICFGMVVCAYANYHKLGRVTLTQDDLKPMAIYLLATYTVVLLVWLHLKNVERPDPESRRWKRSDKM